MKKTIVATVVGGVILYYLTRHILPRLDGSETQSKGAIYA